MVGLLGCTTPGTVMKSWVGHDESGLMAAWGAPDSTVNMANGSKVCTWKRIWNNQNGVYQGRQSFVIGSDGIIKSWSYDNMPRLQRTW